MNHIILISEDGIHFVDNMESVFVDREFNDLVLVGGGRFAHITCDDPEELLDTILVALKRETTSFIEVANSANSANND